MTEAQLFTAACSIIAGLFLVLVALVGWFGSHMMTKLDKLDSSILTLAGDLHSRINEHASRITRVETKLDGLK